MIDFNIEIKMDRGLLDRFKRAAESVLQSKCGRESHLSLRLTTDREVSKLNRIYFGEYGPTDVISFPADRRTRVTFITPEEVIGDIVISYDTASRQAEERGETLLDELERLFAHGFLHLLGYDHGTVGESAVMKRMEKAIMREMDQRTAAEQSDNSKSPGKGKKIPSTRSKGGKEIHRQARQERAR